MGQSGGGEKTERATAKKRGDARKEGQVLKSTEVNTAVTLCVMFAAIRLLGGGMLRNMAEMIHKFLGGNVSIGNTLAADYVSVMFNSVIYDLLIIVGPMLMVALIIGLSINFLQVGFLFTTKPLMPKFSKINPISGFKRIISMRSLVELVKALLKVSVVGFVCYQEYMKNFGEMPNLMMYPLADAGRRIFDMCMNVAFKAGIALIAIGAADYGYQWYDYEKNLKMTKQEVKDEYKMTEGDPKIKSKIKQKQQEMSRMRMMQNVPQADVVITNPTHYAIALRYDDKRDTAPVLLAKGKDLVAQRIKEVAREHNIELVENKPLAQSIYLNVDIGKQIPQDLFQAVAEVLAYVYNIKNPPRADRRTERPGAGRPQGRAAPPGS